MQPTRDKLRVGVCYYPEHWEPSQWALDARHMHEHHLSVVRLAEFAWSRLEPNEGTYDFSWLDRAIETFARERIEVVLGTPTAAPPNWLVAAHPEILPCDEYGRRRAPGVRGHRCFTNPTMRRYASALVEQMARRYGTTADVIGWQIDNEFALQQCTCDSCSSAFRAFLQKRYPSVSELNAAWGTVVWSGEYSSFAEINPPLGGARQLNPSYLLDFRRFENEAICDFQREQVEILRRLCPRHWITHNSWAVPAPLDYERLFAPLDLAGIDYYPSTQPARALTQPYSGALQLDLTRGFKGEPFWVLEQLAGPPGCWMPSWRAPHPGLLRAFGWQSIARGADAVLFFRYRSGLIGAEQFWHGLIDHSGEPGRRFAEAAEFSSEVSRLSRELAGSEVESQVALVYSWEQHTALQLQLQSEGLDYYEHLKLYHCALTRLGLGVDVVGEHAEFGRYKVVVAPMLYLLDDELARRLEEFAQAGGTLVLSHRTGVKNRHNVCNMKPLPAALAAAAGIRVTEYDPLGLDTVNVRDAGGKAYVAT